MQGFQAQVRKNLMVRTIVLFTVIGIGIAGFLIGQWFFSHYSNAVPGGGGPDGVSGPLAVVAAMSVLTAALVLVRRRETSAPGAARDQVSGLYTRDHADEVIAGLIARDDRAGRNQLGLVLMSVDHLESIRRRYGESAVDHAMHLVGSQILGQTRGGDIAARYDDQLVAVFLQCDDLDQVVSFGRRVAMLLSGQQLDWGGDVIKISASMGVVLRLPGESLAGLYARAVDRLAQAMRSEVSRIAA
jgi:diguanylate cyclase (GGDEF)-like protein